jgi:hypothetical protein
MASVRVSFHWQRDPAVIDDDQTSACPALVFVAHAPAQVAMEN